MRRLLLLFLPLLACPLIALAQVPSIPLQSGSCIEKTLSAQQTHTYALKLDKDEYAQVIVEQRSLDVVVRLFLPDGQLLKEFDSPTGAEGNEYVEIVADAAGIYRFEVSSLVINAPAGKYEIKVSELRKATEQELQSHKNESVRKAKGLALVMEASDQLNQVRLTETRVDMQIRSAQLLWEADKKRASTLIAQAMDTVRQFIADHPETEDSDPEDYQLIMKLRRQIIDAVAPHDPEAALKFMQSTRISPEAATRFGESDPEIQLETQLINQIVSADPKRAFELAEDLLKRDLSYQVIGPLTSLAAKDRELAARLAHDVLRKILSQDLIQASAASYLMTSLLQVAKNSGSGGTGNGTENGDGDSQRNLLSNEDWGDAFQKIIAAVLSYSPPTNAVYTQEYGSVRTLATMLRQMPDETKTYGGNRADAVEKKLTELLGNPETPVLDWQRYQNAINNDPVESALESVADAPASYRDALYQSIAAKIANSGDLARARQLVSERMTNPTQRAMALDSLKQQAVIQAATKGKFDEALRLLSKFRRDERYDLLSQILEQLGPGVKRSLALQYLEQARDLISSSTRATNQQEMQTLLAIARKLGRYDLNRGFEIAAPLLDQFNEMAAAAVAMNGFDKDYYQDGELIMSGDNALSVTANDFADTFATLAMFDFDRAKRAAEGISRPEVRLQIYLLIAQRTMEIEIAPDDYGYGYNQ